MTELIRYTVDFTGPMPDSLHVGDTVQFTGKAQVRSISGDMVDVTGIGRDHEFLVGGISVDLVANRIVVEKD